MRSFAAVYFLRCLRWRCCVYTVRAWFVNGCVICLCLTGFSLILFNYSDTPFRFLSYGFQIYCIVRTILSMVLQQVENPGYLPHCAYPSKQSTGPRTPIPFCFLEQLSLKTNDYRKHAISIESCSQDIISCLFPPSIDMLGAHRGGQIQRGTTQYVYPAIDGRMP